MKVSVKLSTPMRSFLSGAGIEFFGPGSWDEAAVMPHDEAKNAAALSAFR